ncbi:UNVERIFIED_ORG: hypothetical protein ABIC54_001622 [Burkholderia sp. 1263]
MHSTQNAANDAFTRLCGALASPNPLGATMDDWRALPDAYQLAGVNLYSWPNMKRYDDTAHEISREARRFGADMLDIYKPGVPGCSRAALARKYGMSVERVNLIMQRADELRILGDPTLTH